MSARTPGVEVAEQERTLEALRRIVPVEQIEEQHEGEPSAGGAWSVEPATEVELVELLRWANACHAAVYTRRPRRSDAEASGLRPRIYLRSGRMKRVIDVDIVSGTVTCQTGITMAELCRELEERGFSTGFPSRPWRAEPLGAIVSASLDAHWGPPYGSMEDQVVGLGVVLPDGTVAHSKAAPRKAVGPDFDRVFLGSRGRFGIVHEVTLRIYPYAARAVWSHSAANLAEALAGVQGLFDLGADVREVEILTPLPDRSWGRKRVGLTDARPVLVLVELHGLPLAESAGLAQERLAEQLTALEPPSGWNVHEGLLPPPRAWTAPVVPVSWAALQDLARTLGSEAPPGLWIVRMSRHGGHLSLADGIEVEAGQGAGAVRALIAGTQAQLAGANGEAALWRRLEIELKRRLDPKNILNPGGI